jgi:hypothetical protein
MGYEPAAMRGATLDLIEDIYISGNGGVFKSTDGGATFVNHNLTYSSNKILTYDYKIMVCVTGATNGGVWIYTDSSLIPVELSNLTANANNGNIELNWSTATELNNSGFEVQRLQNNKITKLQEWEKIGFVPGYGTTAESHFYQYIDEEVENGTYSYRLKQVDFDGSYSYSKTVEAVVNQPVVFSLKQNYPNPFNPVTNIQYEVASIQFISLKVYDVLGNEVATLVNEEKPEGDYEVEFNATGLSSGLYFYQLQAGNYISTKKMIFMK